MLPAIEEYIVQLVMATRNPSQYNDELASSIEFGVSPRGTIALDRCARTHAWLNQRDFVTPDDIKRCTKAVLKHRLVLTPEREMEAFTVDKVIDQILETIEIPR